tara:strand:+ start:221 stop:349 length:129 start_codon:yes stop_codon:yes gene_type:complete
MALSTSKNPLNEDNPLVSTSNAQANIKGNLAKTTSVPKDNDL